MTPDSSYIARFGQNIGLGNYEASRMVFSKWGPFVPLMHSITNLLDQKLYWQYQPVLSLDLVAIVFYTLYMVIRERKSSLQSFFAASVLVSLMVLSNVFLFHVFYIHVNIISALYMYLFVFALIKTQQQPDRAYELLALLSSIAFSLIRIEAPLYVIVILLVTSFRQGWSYVNRLKLIIPFVVLSVAWYARVYFILPEAPDLLTKELAIAVISVLVGFGLFAVLSGLKVLDSIVKRTPLWTLLTLILVSITFTIVKPEHMLRSLESIVRNIFLEGGLGSHVVCDCLSRNRTLLCSPRRNRTLDVYGIGHLYSACLQPGLFLHSVPYRSGGLCKSSSVASAAFGTSVSKYWRVADV